jgi:hypothetical protein
MKNSHPQVQHVQHVQQVQSGNQKPEAFNLSIWDNDKKAMAAHFGFSDCHRFHDFVYSPVKY